MFFVGVKAKDHAGCAPLRGLGCPVMASSDEFRSGEKGHGRNAYRRAGILFATHATEATGGLNEVLHRCTHRKSKLKLCQVQSARALTNGVRSSNLKGYAHPRDPDRLLSQPQHLLRYGVSLWVRVLSIAF
jgi:hypothetical protein